jgi:uncharacterized protein YkwD
MPLTFRCPCGTRLQAANNLLGRHTRCPSCGTVLSVPGPAARAPRETPRRLWPWLVGCGALAFLVMLTSGVALLVLLSMPRSPAALASGPATPAQAPEAAEPPREPAADAPPKRPAPRLPADTDTSALDKLNGYRTAAGLPAVTLDPALCQGCQAHARYLARNFDQLRKQGLSTGDESPDLPGFSEEGRAAAKVAFSGYQPRAAADLVDDWLATVFIRPMLLDTELRRIGWGSARDARGAWFAVLDVTRGKGSQAVVVYPADGQKDAPLAYPGTELPDPIPQATQKRAGYPITVTFPARLPVREVTARLTKGTEEVPVWLSTPEKPAQGEARQRNTVCLIARGPLEPSTTYTVTVKAKVGGAAWSHEGSFTTAQGEQAPAEAPVDQSTAQAVLRQVNGYRKRVGLEAVVLDPGLTRGCQAHADYLVRNADNPATQGLGGHDEDPKLPGFTEEGQKTGKAADIAFDLEPLAAVPAWMATLFHRVPILDPELHRIGFGAAGGGRTGWIVVVDVNSGRGSNQPVFCPADGQKDVPTAYHGGERPDPIPENKDKKAGFPISVQFPRGATVKGAAARLTDAEGQEVAAWVLTPEKTVDRDLQRNSVCLVARQPLRPGTRYTATVTARLDGAAWKQTWAFTTRKGP